MENITAKRLAGRRALVTGAGSGIGLATACRLAADGASVAVLDARDEGVAAAVEAVGSDSTVGLRCDVGDEVDVQQAVERAAASLGGLDVVVTSAGIVRTGSTHDMPLGDWDAVIRVNLTGTFLVLKHSLAHLLAAGGGAIVTIGSVASVVAAGRACSYDASKGGVLQMTKAIAVEYAEAGVRANCVCPGIVTTNLFANSVALHGPDAPPTGQTPPSRLQVPMSRGAAPEEIAAVVAFLCSDDASFVTGSAVLADGGYTAI